MPVYIQLIATHTVDFSGLSFYFIGGIVGAIFIFSESKNLEGVFCRNCGKQVGFDVKFCKKCGNKIAI